MKTNPSPARPVALALLMAATALSTTAFAQDTPPVSATVAPTAAAPAPAPAAAAPEFAPRAEIAQPTPPRPEIEAAIAAATAQPTRAVARPRPAPRQTISIARSVPENIIAVPAEPTPTVAAPVEAAPPSPEPVRAEPVAVETEPATATGETNWTLIIGGLLIAGAIAAFLLSRRRRGEREVFHAPVDAEGVPVAEVNLNERPWIRLALQPKPAETANDQKVEYELTVENEGRVAAHDVRVSSFMFAGADSSPQEAALIDDGRNARHIDVAPGETVRLAGSFDIRDFLDPKLIADARYALPDGGEGHLAAKFGIDLSTPERQAHVEDVLDRV